MVFEEDGDESEEDGGGVEGYRLQARIASGWVLRVKDEAVVIVAMET